MSGVLILHATISFGAFLNTSAGVSIGVVLVAVFLVSRRKMCGFQISGYLQAIGTLSSIAGTLAFLRMANHRAFSTLACLFTSLNS